ncbi:FAD-dependent oxidoreductase [Saccharothrix coeruleofusca]|uniref:FAD-dependent oxidoreductase n=1 Tax=Saccharothrix coeruleofusca TaxID=33919 RepID=A0A918EFR6_9PSEU|nr:NAD(P)/FAD-dependent oxidoreductase [Saccharothrix coeruleofusca]MBP2335995.1 putative FAD-dependent dehydrogenase [Saccharothrix coeruleofusca]GGP76116.1 FAD-dependent oxidoreductase [Saccharothrix coeruleofusca]
MTENDKRHVNSDRSGRSRSTAPVTSADATAPAAGPPATDLVVIGGGPAGLFAALTAARAGLRATVLEAGGDMGQSLCPRVVARLKGRTVREAEKFRLQCPRCDCLTGLGGAAFHFDTNLGYIAALTRSKIEAAGDGTTRSYSGLERALGSFDRAQDLIAEVYRTMFALGLPEAGAAHQQDGSELQLECGVFEHVDTAQSQSVTVDVALDVIANLCAELADAGSQVLLRHRATEVLRQEDGTFLVRAQSADGLVELHAPAVVVATGKLGLPWVQEVIRANGVRHRPARRVDVGVRLETSQQDMAPLLDSCHNPKLSFLNDRGEAVRTFCVCGGGRVMQYSFLGAVALDGQHCLNQPTSRSNMGILTTVDVPEGEDGTDYARRFATRVAEYGGGRPVVCTVDELRGAAAAGEPSTSLIDYRHGNLRDCLPESVVRDVLEMVDRLNALHPGLVPGTATVAAPVVERLFPDLELSGDMESSVPGLYFVGDSSSKIIGITYGAATGIAAARSVAARLAPALTGGGR